MYISPEISTILTAMAPIGELRVALPIALLSYKIDIWLAYVLSVFGNMIPVFFLLIFWKYFVKFFIKHSKTLERFFNWLFERTRKKTEKQMTKYGPLALIIFVAIPLPNTGAWTGSIAAWLFGIPKRKAILYIFYGVLIAGVVVTAITIGHKNIELARFDITVLQQ